MSPALLELTSQPFSSMIINAMMLPWCPRRRNIGWSELREKT
jgi:hypothetical protein